MAKDYIPIEVIALFETTGCPIPHKFQISTGNNTNVVKVDRVMEIDNTQFYCGATFVYKCRSVIRNQERIYKIMYNIPKYRWYYIKES